MQSGNLAQSADCTVHSADGTVAVQSADCMPCSLQTARAARAVSMGVFFDKGLLVIGGNNDKFVRTE